MPVEHMNSDQAKAPDAWPRHWDGSPVAPGEATSQGTIEETPRNREKYQRLQIDHLRNEHRLKRLYIPEREVLDVMTKCLTRAQESTHRLVWSGAKLPSDVRVLAVCHDFSTRCFGFLLQHPSFDVVPDGDYIPTFSYTESRWEWVEIPRSEAK